METKITNWEWPRKYSTIKDKKIGAFGCSHTWGLGVDYYQSWPWLLGASNFGFVSGSTDFIVRNIEEVVDTYSLKKVYILYPSYTRFEYINNNLIWQSLPTDKNRYLFKDRNEESWLINNHSSNKKYINDFCLNKNIELVDIEFEFLHQHIDYPDRWPLASDGMHYSAVWHSWVAEIFKNYEKTKQ